MSADQKQVFFQFNIGHLLTLVTILISVVVLYGQREREMAVIQTTIEAHGSTLRDHGERLGIMDKTGTTASTARVFADHQALVALTARVDSQAVAIAKMEAMATDIAWIKAELLRRRSSQD